jgi:hypothetical protein
MSCFVYVVIHICASVWSFRVETNICMFVFFVVVCFDVSIICVCVAFEDPAWHQINQLNLASQKPILEFPTHISWSFLCSMILGER